MRPRSCIAAVVAAALVGCASPGGGDDGVAALYRDPAYAALQQSARNIQDAANRLAAVEEARYWDAKGELPYRADAEDLPGLAKHLSLGAAWHGPLMPLVERVAAATGYTAQKVGVEPAGGVIVNVDTDYRRALDILHDAGTQAGSRARLTVHSRTRLLEVEYLAP